jgi:hypothetical protein
MRFGRFLGDGIRDGERILDGVEIREGEEMLDNDCVVAVSILQIG